MARATHLTIGTADRIRLDARRSDFGNGDDEEEGNEVRQEVQVSVTYALYTDDTDLTALAAEKAEEVQRAHEAAWNRIGAFRNHALGNSIPGCTCCPDQAVRPDTTEDEDDGPEDGLEGDPIPPNPPPSEPPIGGYRLPDAWRFRNGHDGPEANPGLEETDLEPATGPQRILIRSRAKKAGLTAYALERLLHEQFQVWRIERLTKAQAATLLDALERDLKERDMKGKGNGSAAPSLAAGGSYSA